MTFRQVVIENSSDPGEARVKNDGLGLEIVERVCDHQGWALSVNQKDDSFAAQVMFKQ